MVIKCHPKMAGVYHCLTHWGRVTYICVSKLTITGSDNGLSPSRRQAIVWTDAGILLIGPLKTNFNEILSKIHTFSFKKMHLNMSSAKWRPFCLGLNVLNYTLLNPTTHHWQCGTTEFPRSRPTCFFQLQQFCNFVKTYHDAHALHKQWSNKNIFVQFWQQV